MGASQRGILRPRKAQADDELRAAILEALSQLQGTRTLSALASDLRVSVKTLSRYCGSNKGKPASLGGDVLFRICELCDERGLSVSCRSRLLRVPKVEMTSPSGVPADQLRFTFTGTFDVDLPARKGVMKVASISADDRTGTDPE